MNVFVKLCEDIFIFFFTLIKTDVDIGDMEDMGDMCDVSVDGYLRGYPYIFRLGRGNCSWRGRVIIFFELGEEVDEVGYFCFFFLTCFGVIKGSEEDRNVFFVFLEDIYS